MPKYHLIINIKVFNQYLDVKSQFIINFEHHFINFFYEYQ